MAKNEYKSITMTGQDPRDESTKRFKKTGRYSMEMHPEDFKINREIQDRDTADMRKAEDKARRGEKPTKLELMAYRDAADRLNRSGIAVEGTNRDTSKGYTLKEGDATGKRLIKKYEAEGKPVKKMAMGGSVSKRADGCAVKGKTKGRFV